MPRRCMWRASSRLRWPISRLPMNWVTGSSSSASPLVKPQRAPMQRHEGGYYIRLAAVDRPGTAATIARRMADENISLESIMQRGRDRRPHGGDDPRSVDKPAPVALITYATSEDAVRRALSAVENDGVLTEKPQVIRIEKG